jgi:hypothetical protein
MTAVDLRCPVTPRRLFAQVQCGQAFVDEENTITVACPDCRTAMRRMGRECRLVLHQFNMLGVCLHTSVE